MKRSLNALIQNIYTSAGVLEFIERKLLILINLAIKRREVFGVFYIYLSLRFLNSNKIKREHLVYLILKVTIKIVLKP